jgi:tol-pal system protein YbgF
MAPGGFALSGLRLNSVVSHNLDAGYSNVVGVFRSLIVRAPMNRNAIRTLALAALGCAALGGARPVFAQASVSDVMIRLDQLENQMRQLTGTMEQLQYRNQQLEQALRRMQEDNEFRFQQLGGKGAATASQARPSGPAPMQAPAPGPAPQQSIPGRRSDAFDPSQNPSAPGVPRTLGSMSGSASLPPPVDQASNGIVANDAPMGPAGSRTAGAPLDLSTLSGAAANEMTSPSSGNVRGPDIRGSDNGQLPPPPPRNPNATGGQMATLPPSQTPKDEYDLAYGYLLRKDYALAEDGFHSFLRKYPSDRLSADAQFWLGETMFQQQSYRDAADAFLNVSKKYETSTKAPDALLRLGQSLAAMGQKELACATFGEVGIKYPRATLNVKQSVEREQKRVRC